jgi:hypothetical protein
MRQAVDKNAIQPYDWMAFQILSYRAWRIIGDVLIFVVALMGFERKR